MLALVINKNMERSSRDVYYVLFRHKRKVILFFCCVMMVVILGTLLTPESFRSDAKIMVRLGRESVTLDPTATTGPILSVAQSRENEVKSEMEILKSRELVEKVVDTIGPDVLLRRSKEGTKKSSGMEEMIRLASEGIMRFLKILNLSHPLSDRDRSILRTIKGLEFEALKNSDIISISFIANDRKLAQGTIEKLIEFYLDKHIDVRRTQGSLEFFTQKTDQFRNTLFQIEGDLKELKNKTGITSLEEQRRMLIKGIGDLQQEVEAAESSLAASKMKVQTLERTLAKLPETHVTQRVTGNANQGVDLMRSKLYELELKEQDLLSKYTGQSKPVMEIRRQIAEAKALLEKEEPTRTQVTWGINEAYKQVELALLAEKATFSSLQAKAKELRDQLIRARSELMTLNHNEIELTQVQREITMQEANYRKYSEKLEHARIDQALEMRKISNIAVIQPPTYPLKPVQPKTVLNISLGLFLAIFGGISLAFFSEYLDHSFRTPEDVEKKLGVPTLASISYSESGLDNKRIER